MLDTVLEIIKITVPALIVFLTVYFLQKQFLKNQYNLQLLDLKKNQIDSTLPLKLQAYERLTLFLERIKLENLILRIRTEKMTASNLHIAYLFLSRRSLSTMWHSKFISLLNYGKSLHWLKMKQSIW